MDEAEDIVKGCVEFVIEVDGDDGNGPQPMDAGGQTKTCKLSKKRIKIL